MLITNSETGIKFNMKAVDYSQNVCVTTTLVGLSCQADSCGNLQGSPLGNIGDYFSPLVV